jgi:CheY-like chemotaxis protein/HPt (histidine-containing phosphotransfer) domain-containing protein
VTDRFQGPFLRGVRVLVVDDSEENREVLRFLLADAGAVCHTAANGAAGVDAARAAAAERKAFDLVLMDLSMPGLDGFAATRTLVAERVPGRVIALSALSAKEDRDAALAAGCVDALAKPIVPTVFFETLARHVGLDRARGPIPSTNLPFFDDPRFTPLVARYVATFAELAAKLRIAHELGSLEEVRLQAHRLRGTAANYGFPEISTVAGECEDALRARAGANEVAERVAALLALLHAAAA